MKGFLAFALSAVFLLAIVAASARISDSKHSSSYQKYQMLHLQELAIKSAFYDSTASAARGAYSAAVAAGVPPRQAVEDAVAANAAAFEEGLRAQGYDVVFWCGQAGPEALQSASGQMAGEKRAAAPATAVPLAQPHGAPAPPCAQSFQADVLTMKIHISGLGFSSYSGQAGMGYATPFPSSNEVGF